MASSTTPSHDRVLVVALCFHGFTASSLVACGSPSAASEGPAESSEGEVGSSEADDASDSTTTASDQFFSDEELATILTWLGPLPPSPIADPTNVVADDPEAALLGQKLFFDPRYSGNGEVSCATCHDPAHGFADDRANTSEGISYTGRSSMSLLNAAYGAAAEETMTWQFWDGRKDTQWSQALAPPESETEMGSARTTVALLVYDSYRAEYEAVFGAMPELRDGSGTALVPAGAMPGTAEWDALTATQQDDVNLIYANFGKAIGAYERLLASRNSRFDAFWEDLAGGATDSDLLSEQEKEGLRVFIGAGRCLGCHGGPNFTDGQFHNIAVPQIGDNVPTTDTGRAYGIETVLADEFNCAGPWSDHPDKSTCAVMALEASQGEIGAFKTPSLRSTGSTAPYMHTGDFESLADVVQHYDIGGAPNGTFDGIRDELIRPLSLTASQRADLVAFLMTLEGEPLDPALLEPPA